MIRTVLTLRMGTSDMQNTTFLVNDTQIGYLAPGGRRNHVLSSHRYIQLIAGIRSDDNDPASAAAQRERLHLWQRCSRDVQQRGLSILAQAAAHYRIKPDWLIGIDKKYMHAWLMERYGIFLMREGELFQVEPVSDQSGRVPDIWHNHLLLSTIEIMEGDYYLFLPPEFFNIVSAEEVQDVLGGMQQLSVKINELVELARLRNYDLSETWLALQVQRIEQDTEQAANFMDKLTAFRSQFRKTNTNEANKQRSDNSSLRQTTRNSIDDSNADLAYINDRKRRSDSLYDGIASDADLAAKPGTAEDQKDREIHERAVSAAARHRMGDRQPAGKTPYSGVSAEAKAKSSKKGLLDIWNSWRREQKWLAVLLALSVLVLVAWGISSLAGGKEPESTTETSTTVESTLPTPTPIPPAQTTTLAPAETKMVVNVRSLNFREQPGTDGALIVSLAEGSLVTQLAEPVDGWVKVKLSDGREAYAFAEYLSVVEE